MAQEMSLTAAAKLISGKKYSIAGYRLQLPKIYKVRGTAHFCVEDGCVGCGLCAKKCLVQAIEMRNKKPVWVKDKCVMCLGCLHRCPKFAIQYGKNTKKHGQYTNPNVKI